MRFVTRHSAATMARKTARTRGAEGQDKREEE